MSAECSFSELVEGYLTMRRSLGYRLERQATYLRGFGAYLDRAQGSGPVLLERSAEWACATTSTDPHHPARRLAIVRGFLSYLAGIDGASEVPPGGFLGPTCHRTPPHIYTDEEIDRLLQAAAELPPHDGLRPQCYVTLFGLLACTGLRISEAVALSLDDVDLAAGVLDVRAGKGGKPRLVPLHPSAVELLASYASQRERLGTSGGFFRTERNERLSTHAVEVTFRRLRRQLGWEKEGGARPPRVHDLRHRAVVKRVLLWHAESADVDAKLPVLATYLGHTLVSDLYWYFSATPELMGIAAERFASGTPGEQSFDGAR
ncbi:MAG: tyrosine-type recombinase/integrase [Actinomycetota bacterium]|nr:tyrosine-type recombinase/integrase [Actinomycetota bacterium]